MERSSRYLWVWEKRRKNRGGSAKTTLPLILPSVCGWKHQRFRRVKARSPCKSILPRCAGPFRHPEAGRPGGPPDYLEARPGAVLSGAVRDCSRASLAGSDIAACQDASGILKMWPRLDFAPAIATPAPRKIGTVPASSRPSGAGAARNLPSLTGFRKPKVQSSAKDRPLVLKL